MVNVKFTVTLNPHKNCIRVDGEGQAEITFTTDATQLAQILKVFAKYKGKRIKITCEGVDNETRQQKERPRQILSV